MLPHGEGVELQQGATFGLAHHSLEAEDGLSAEALLEETSTERAHY